MGRWTLDEAIFRVALPPTEDLQHTRHNRHISSGNTRAGNSCHCGPLTTSAHSTASKTLGLFVSFAMLRGTNKQTWGEGTGHHRHPQITKGWSFRKLYGGDQTVTLETPQAHAARDAQAHGGQERKARENEPRLVVPG